MLAVNAPVLGEQAHGDPGPPEWQGLSAKGFGVLTADRPDNQPG